MYRISAFAILAALWVSPAIALPADPQERAVACYVYGAWAPDDARSAVARAAIQAAVDRALAAGTLTHKELNDRFSETASIALYDEPRAELLAKWNDCRESFAPV
jgi:hypothetical protein